MEDNNIRVKLQDTDPSVRREACEAIAEARDDRFISELVSALYDESAGVKEAAIAALTNIGGRDASDAVAPLLRSDDPVIRNMGIEILQIIGPDALDTISKLLRDSDDDVVKFAVDMIANIKDERSIGLLKTLIDHPNPNVRGSVAVCLGRLNAKDAVGALHEALGDSEHWVRFSAIESLGILNDKTSLEPLMKLIESDPGMLKEAALDAVSKIAEPDDAAKVLTEIMPALRCGEIVGVSAIVGLMEKALAPGSSFRLDNDFKRAYFDFFSKAVDDSEMQTRISAVSGLGLLKMPEGLKRVFDFADTLKEIDEETDYFLVNVIVSISGHGKIPDILFDEVGKNGRNMLLIVKAFGLMRSLEAVPILQELIQSVTKHELRFIVTALGQIGSDESVDALTRSLKSPDGHARKTAARALSALSGEAAIPHLLSAMWVETYRDVMEEITDALSAVPSDLVRNAFYEMLDADREALREMGARGLGLIGDEQSLNRLGKAAGDVSPNVRKVAYNAIARLGFTDAIDLVIAGLKDKDDDVRLSVMKALGEWSGDKIKDALLDALDDRNVWVRYHAVLLLGDIFATDVEDRIIDVLENDDAPVKVAAVKSLEKMGSKKSIEVLKRFENHPDAAVSGVVKNAIWNLQC